MRKGISVLLIVIITGFLTGCINTIEKNFEELNRIERIGNYEIVGQRGIVKGDEIYDFVTEISKKITTDGKTIQYDQGYIDNYRFENDRFYFFYNYYRKKPLSSNDSVRSYCLGFIDLLTKEVISLEYYENISLNYRNIIYSVLGDYLFFAIGDRFNVYQIESRAIIEEYDFSDIDISPIFNRDQTFMFRKDSVQNFYYLKNGITVKTELTFECEENYFDHFSSGLNAIYKIDGKNQYFGYNLESKEALAEEVVLDLVDEYHQHRGEIRYDNYTLNDISYSVEIDEQQIDFINKDTEEKKTLTLEYLRTSSPEYSQIMNHFNRKELTFYKIIKNGDQLFLVLINGSSFFGLYDGSPPPIVYRYNLITNEIAYIGYYAYVYIEPVRVYAK